MSNASTPAAAGDSLRKRYLFKLIANAAGIPLYFVLEALMPRALGPAAYGNFSFATNVFQQFSAFLDMGTSTCLATTLSKKPDDDASVALYLRFSLIVLALCLGAGCLALIPTVGEALLPGVPAFMAPAAAFWAYLTWAGRTTRSVNDALGLTVGGEALRTIVSLLSALALAGLFLAGVLSIPVLFLHQYIFLGAAAVGFALLARRAKPGWNLRLPRETAKERTRMFWAYSSPLFIAALGSAAALSGERWMLQFFGGSVEQGFFSLGQKVGMACFLFVTALTPLLMREMAAAHGSNNPRLMAALVDRYAPMIYAVSAWFACFTFAEAPAVVRLFGGAAFAGAVWPVAIMSLYPIHQGYGQVAASVFYAAGETRAYRNLTLITLVPGTALSWFVLAPGDLFGLDLGSYGLAVKMVLVQAISVNILLFACRRIVPFGYGRNLLHQLVAAPAFALAAFACRLGTEYFAPADNLWRFFGSGFLYCLITGLLILLVPFLAGLKREDFAKLRSWRRPS